MLVIAEVQNGWLQKTVRDHPRSLTDTNRRVTECAEMSGSAFTEGDLVINWIGIVVTVSKQEVCLQSDQVGTGL